MSRLTRLHRSGHGRIALEVDGQPWRVVPDEVVLRCGLRVGIELERPLLREIRRELRRADALAVAARALARRDLSRGRLAERLRARGVARETEERAVAALEDAGLVDDRRLARTRAAALADRGWGDAAIEERLGREAIAADLVRAALDELPPESERAMRLTASAGDQRKAWALLMRRGFAVETIEEAVGMLDADA